MSFTQHTSSKMDEFPREVDVKSTKQLTNSFVYIDPTFQIYSQIFKTISRLLVLGSDFKLLSAYI